MKALWKKSKSAPGVSDWEGGYLISGYSEGLCLCGQWTCTARVQAPSQLAGVMADFASGSDEGKSELVENSTEEGIQVRVCGKGWHGSSKSFI